MAGFQAQKPAPPILPTGVTQGGQVDLSGRSNVNTGVIGPGRGPAMTPQERQRQINQGIVAQRKANRQKKLAAMDQAKMAGQKQAMRRPLAPPPAPGPGPAPLEPAMPPVLQGRNQGGDRY